MNHPTHEATAHDTAVKSPPKETKSDPSKSADKPVLAEGTGGIKVVRFKLGDQVKSLNLPVTGAELHRIAGGATKLTIGGKAVENNSEPVEIADDAEVSAVY